jgi:hypothetical protein
MSFLIDSCEDPHSKRGTGSYGPPLK